MRVPNYRLYFIGQTVSVMGNQMQLVAVAFLVLELTHSGTALGVAIATRLAPLFVLGPFGGLLADRMDKRRVLFLTQSMSAAGAIVLAVLAWSGAASYPIVLLVSLVMGSFLVLDNPARQSLIGELVDREVLANAVVLNSVSVNVARAFGSVLGGALVAAVGASTGFVINALTFVFVLGTLIRMRPADIRVSTPVPRRPGQLREGWRYIARTPEIALPLVMLTVTGTLAYEYPTSLPLLAVDAFHGDAQTYGWMAASMAVGSIVAGLVVAGRASPPGYHTLALTCLGWGACTLLAAAAPGLVTELLLLLAVGYGSMSMNATSKTAMQLAARPDMRGRVMSLWAMSWTASAVIGGPIVGVVGEHVGSRWALVVGGVATVVIGAVTWPHMRRVARRRATRPPGGPRRRPVAEAP